jgi:hypothetical protein
LIFSSLALINALQILYFQNRVRIEYDALTFKINNWVICYHLINDVLLTEQILLSQALNYSNSTIAGLEGDVWLVNSQPLPKQYFSDYLNLYFLKVFGNLCLLINQSMVTFDIDDCTDVGNGLFMHGEPLVI